MPVKTNLKGADMVPTTSTDIKDFLNVTLGPVVYEIDKWWALKFAESIDDPNPKWKKETPPTFPTALILEDLHQAVVKVYGDLTHILNGGNELEYFKPICVGDRISVTGKIVSVRERTGKMGKMVIIATEEFYTNQRGEVAAICRSNTVKY
jgi:hypothetical protein